MTKQIQTSSFVLGEIAARFGSSEDTQGLIGKTIRIVDHPALRVPSVLREIFNGPEFEVGAEGVVIAITADGHLWADFGDDERAWAGEHEDGKRYRVADVGPSSAPSYKLFEVIQEGEAQASTTYTRDQLLPGTDTLQ